MSDVERGPTCQPLPTSPPALHIMTALAWTLFGFPLCFQKRTPTAGHVPARSTHSRVLRWSGNGIWPRRRADQGRLVGWLDRPIGQSTRLHGHGWTGLDGTDSLPLVGDGALAPTRLHSVGSVRREKRPTSGPKRRRWARCAVRSMFVARAFLRVVGLTTCRVHK